MYIPFRVRALRRMLSPLLTNERRLITDAFTINNNFKTTCSRALLTNFKSYSTAASELKNRINEELKYELESESSKNDKETALQYLKSNSWNVNDVEGDKYVSFTKNHGNKRITIVLDVDTIGNDTGKEYMDDEYENESQRNNLDETEDQDEELNENDQIEACAVIENIKNPEKAGVLKIDLDLSDENFLIKQVEHYNDRNSAFDSVYNPLKSNVKYTGPQYHTLDSEIQKLYENYLEELKLDTGLAKCLYSYSLFKEFNEYTNWLKKTEGFFTE